MPGGTEQTLRPFLWRAERLYPDREVVSRTHDERARYTYSEYADRARQLGDVIAGMGLGDGARVGTFCWNHHRHFETYFGVPNVGAQLHTINPLLPDHHVEYIVDNAEDRVLFVDPSLVGKLEGAAGGPAFESVEQFVVMGEDVPDTDLDPVVDYESFLADGDPDIDFPNLSGDRPAGMCYTSGTTGKPKGVEYTHQMLWSHTMGIQTPHGIPIEDRDAVMPVVPMFHVNAWGLPFAATAGGAKHVYPGPSPTPEDLVRLIEQEGVTLSAGVPTVWLGVREYTETEGADLSSLERVVIGGSAAPKSLIEWYADRDVEVVHAWGMTEMSPIGTVAEPRFDLPDDEEAIVGKRAKQGLPVPGLEMKVVGDGGEEKPWNGEDFGELLVRGPWVTKEYFKRPDANEESFDDGWLRTGDVVTIDTDGYVQLVDRTDDVIKSGGEWISSVELENTLMASNDVAEAAVVGVSHDRWGERPVAYVVTRDDFDGDHDELKTELLGLVEADYPKWWRPDEVEFIDEIPKTATGKFSKMTLREERGDTSITEGSVPEEAAPESDD